MIDETVDDQRVVMDFFGGRHIVVSIIGNAGLGIKVAATQNGKCDMDQLTLEDADLETPKRSRI